MPLSHYLKIYPCLDRPGYSLLYSTRKGSIARISEATLAAAIDGTLQGNDLATLQHLQMLVDDAEAERAAMASMMARTNARSRRFEATVVLTLDCNLACQYCFEDRFRGRYAMTRETVMLLVEHIRTKHIEMGRDVAIRFYGGEPLMAVEMLKEIARPLQEAASALGTKFSFSIVTNGTLLTRQIATDLLPLGLKTVQFTLDGPREIHDGLRPFVSGKGSYDLILANLKSVCDLINIDLGGNFSRDNYREFPKMLDAIVADGINPEQIGPVLFAPVFPKSGEKVTPELAASCPSSHEQWVVAAILYLREETGRRGFKVLKPTMGACMVEFDNDLVVNWDGSFYKCPAFMGWPELAVGTLATGSTDYRISHGLDIWQNDECLDCAYLPLCFGGCRLLTMLKNGVINEVDCRKAFYDAALETMILQGRHSPASEPISPLAPEPC
jgi:uncharacterized protein